MKKFFTVLFCLFSISLLAEIPNKPVGFVNDFANILTTKQVNKLEHELQKFSDSTSNQICVVTVSTLDGYEPADYAQRVGQKWGVGSNKNNGVVILIKPKKLFENGEVFIATGYGIEGALTDALCKRIINNYMLPELKDEHYYNAINEAIQHIKPIMLGEYTEADANFDDLLKIILYVVIFIVCLLILIYIDNHSTSSSSIFFSGGSSSSHSSSFGGFGGGSFGGGGAGGHF